MPSTTLYAGQTLQPGEYLESANRLFRAVMRKDDGKFVVYHHRRTPSVERTSAWGMGPASGQGAILLNNNEAKQFETQRPAGTLRQRRGCGPAGLPGLIYACKFGSDPFLVMQDDGNLVYYSHTPSGIKPIWASDTVVGKPKLPKLTAPGVLAIEVEDAVVSESGPYVFTNGTAEDALFYSAGAVAILEPDDSIVLSQPGTLAIDTNAGLALSNGGAKQLLHRYSFGIDNQPDATAGNVDALPITFAVDQPQPRFFRITKIGSSFQLHRRTSD